MLKQDTVIHPAWKLWSNPILRRYCRSRLRPQALGVWILLVVLICIYAVVASTAAGIRMDLSDSEAQRIAFIPIFILQAFILFVLGTANVSGGMTREADEGVIDYQRLIPMSPLAKVLGFLFGLPAREYAIFLATVPFTLWTVWRGNVDIRVWFPLYVAFFSSAWLYHLTGLVTGTVIKNRRWAFLASMAIVFCLYTVVPQVSKLGIVFFKYLTIMPTLEESWRYFIPENSAAVVQVIRNLAAKVTFFGLDFPEYRFTVFSQSGLILTLVVMLCRNWRRHDAQLLGKFWSLGLMAWIQILLLGNALPAINTGELFPSRELTSRFVHPLAWSPQPEETAAITAAYGILTLILIVVLANIITPSKQKQLLGWRRAAKLRLRRLALNEEAASALPFVIGLSLIGAGGWYLFTHGLVESVWYPGHTFPPRMFVIQWVVLLTGSLCFHALLEARGRRTILIALIFIGAVPLLVATIAAILGGIGNTLSLWIAGTSPVSVPVYFSLTQLDIVVLPAQVRFLHAAFLFYQLVFALGAVYLVVELIGTRRALKRRVLGESGAGDAVDR